MDAKIVAVNESGALLNVSFPSPHCDSLPVVILLKDFTTKWRMTGTDPAISSTSIAIVVPIMEKIFLQGIIICGSVTEVLAEKTISTFTPETGEELLMCFFYLTIFLL